MTNPFIPPGAVSPGDPLCPWRYPDQKTWYADVDSAEAEFQRFTDRIDIAGLAERGRLVVIAGLRGCGKTSLAHRCAEHVDEHTNRVANPPLRAGHLILDLSRYVFPPVRQNDEIDIRRLCEVAAQISRFLVRANVAPVNQREVDRHLGNERHREALETLTRSLEGTSYTLIVLLPPISDFVNELQQYFYITQEYGSIVFLAESSDRKVKNYVDQERDRNEVIALRVAPLDGGDGWKFIKDRTIDRGNHPTSIAPEQVQRALAWIDFTPLTIGFLLALCWKAWEPTATSTSPRALDALDLIGPASRYLRPDDSGYRTGGDRP